jgi:hypothetical protein
MLLLTLPWMVTTQMRIFPWEGHLVSQDNLACPTIPLCRPQCLAERARKLRCFLVWRIVGYLCVQGGEHNNRQYVCGKHNGKCALKGQQAHQKISKEVGKSSYYQPATCLAWVRSSVDIRTVSVMSAISARKLEE